MNRFDFYEFVGILSPGVAFIIGISLIFPDIGEIIQKQNFSLGDFGVVVIAAYIVGHLVQAFGNILEKIYWQFWGGMPTDWVRSKKHSVISNGQAFDLETRLKTTLEEEQVSSIKELSQGAWSSIVNELYGRIKATNLDERAYIFNGHYGLMRGIAASLLLILIVLLVNDINAWRIDLFVFAGFLLAIFRMHRFGKYYARELFTSFLNISELPNNKGE